MDWLKVLTVLLLVLAAVVALWLLCGIVGLIAAKIMHIKDIVEWDGLPDDLVAILSGVICFLNVSEELWHKFSDKRQPKT